MKVLSLLLHDERFSGWTVADKLARQHFSIQYMRFCKQKGWDPLLYSFHQHARTKQIYRVKDAGIVKIFPVKFRCPPFLSFANDHNPPLIMREAMTDQPDIVHFHNYYLASYPYTATFVKKKLKKPLVAQLHSYIDSHWRRWLYLPSLLALKHADHILYSYGPEEKVYRKLGLAGKATKVPIPGFDPQIFKREKRCNTDHLLYVGRIPRPERAYGEKSPLLLLYVLRKLLRHSKEVVFDIVGDGPGLLHARCAVNALGLGKHVVFHGYVPYDELPKYYQSSALAFSPIRVYDVDGWFDGTIQESLACGTPVAAFKVSSKTQLRGTCGFLLSNNLEKAAGEVAELLKRPEDMDQVAEYGSKFVREKCSCANVAAELQKTWESVI